MGKKNLNSERWSPAILSLVQHFCSCVRWLIIGLGITHLSLVQAASNPLETLTNPSTLASCLTPQAGAPSCGVDNAPGSSTFSSVVPRHVGNPIDVVSGNKYQYELDYKSFSSGLTLSRHYNSSLTSYKSSFGPGWRHTYQVLLTSGGNSHMNIVQSDGRLISFYPAPNSDSPNIYTSTSPSDGYLEVGKRSIWHLPDGRQLYFQGSFLVMIDFGDHRGTLRLQYRGGKLFTVTDFRGDKLTFAYNPGKVALPEYGSNETSQPAGSIASVTIPTGDTIEYTYGPIGNLIKIQYPDGDSVGYGYNQKGWPNHLSERHSTADNRHSEWRYDDSGLGVGWVENSGTNGLEVIRHNPNIAIESTDLEKQPSATVTYVDGRQTHYYWNHDVGIDTGNNGPLDISCDNCVQEQFIDDSLTTTENATAANTTQLNTTQLNTTQLNTTQLNTTQLNRMPTNEIQINEISRTSSSQSTVDAAVPQLWQSLKRITDQADHAPGHTTYVGTYPHQEGDIRFQLTSDRTGNVSDLMIGQRRLGQIIATSLSETPQPCFSGDFPENTETYTHDRILALGNGNDPCELDGVLAIDLIEKLDSYANARNKYDLASESTGPNSRKKDIPWWDPMHRYCELPSGQTCSDMQENLKMAKLSQCAYGVVSCEPEFRLVSPEEIGLSPERFDDQGFDAQLYYDDAQERYILVFRGTDGVGDDWDANLAQAKGLWTRQYDLAVRLSIDVEEKLGGDHLIFTGHSLGGGLATIAALQIQQNATVFNTAAVQPGTAALYNLMEEYQDADQYISHIHTKYDPVTVLQEVLDDLDYKDMQTAPGVFTEIKNPDFPWMEEANARAETFLQSLAPMIRHSIEAVIHVLESLIKYNCVS